MRDGLGSDSVFDVPGQQLTDPADVPIRDFFKAVPEISRRIEIMGHALAFLKRPSRTYGLFVPRVWVGARARLEA